MSEQRELSELRDEAIAWAAAEARARFRDLAGLAAEEESGAGARARAFVLAGSGEGLAQACEALAAVDPVGKPARASRLSGLRALLVRARAEALEPGLFDRLAALPRLAAVELPGDAGLHGKLPPRAVERELWRERSRQKRADQEAALADAAGRSDGLRADAWEAAQAALGELGQGEPAEAAAGLHLGGWAQRAQGEPAAAQVAAACERLLRETDALAGDLLAWLLERHTGARRHPGGAGRHDLFHLLHAPRCAPAFPRGELVRTCRRWAEGLRLELAAGGAIRLDEEDRPLKAPGAFAVPLEPPDEVALTLLAAEGPRALADLLGALAVAQLRAGPPADAPAEDFFCGDPAVAAGCAALLAGLVRDHGFRRRCAKVDLGPDDGRAVAVGLLVDARLAAAQALSELAAHREGLGARAEALHRDLFARAALCELPGGAALCGLEPLLGGWDRLRGLCLAARARQALRERFDEDFWRNPGALPALRGLWARGGRPTLRELWRELGPDEEPSLRPLLDELAEACR